jgi:hypothetical protein
MVGPEEVAIVAIVFGSIGAIGFPIARALARRLEGSRSAAPPLSSDLSERLERIERTVESVALEVERISEGQRFVTKLMSERTEPGRLPGSPIQH